VFSWREALAGFAAGAASEVLGGSACVAADFSSAADCGGPSPPAGWLTGAGGDCDGSVAPGLTDDPSACPAWLAGSTAGSGDVTCDHTAKAATINATTATPIAR
jgi:hypothetical protein